MNDIGPRIVGALFFALFVGGVTRIIVKPTPHLASRLRPYTASSRSILGRSPEASLGTGHAPTSSPHGVAQRLFRPIVESLVNSVMKIFGSAFDDVTLSLRLKQAGVLPDVPDADRAHEYRIRQVGSGLGWAVCTGLVAAVIGIPPSLAVIAALGGGFIGVTRISGNVGKKTEDRRARMRVELYTVNQLMAIYLRTSGSPVLAAQRLVRRGRGSVIDELNEALRLHTRGMAASRAFGRIADQTPEPFAARTYKLLASGSERGADLAQALLSLSEDVREHRRTEVKRGATKRQAAILLPILIFLAPTMLLFIAAPLPSLIFQNIK